MPESRSGTQAIESGATTPERRRADMVAEGAGRTEPLTESKRCLPEREDLSRLGRRRKWCLFACSCLLQFLLQLDMASVAVTLPVSGKSVPLGNISES